MNRGYKSPLQECKKIGARLLFETRRADKMCSAGLHPGLYILLAFQAAGKKKFILEEHPQRTVGVMII